LAKKPAKNGKKSHGGSHGKHGGHGGGGHEEAHEEGEPWLVSYADMMTLLFGFFVVMYSFANAKLEALKLDKADAMVQMRKEIANYFGGEFITPLDKVVEEFQKKMEGTDITKNIDTKLTPEGMEIMFRSSTIFASGSADLFPFAKNAIETLIDLVKEKSTELKTDFKIVVEGHTDDVPIRTNGKFPSNWELSAARAGSVIRLFESKGFDPKQLVAVGYGSSKPIAPNRDDAGQSLRENQEKNRRVLIKVAMAEADASRTPGTFDTPQPMPPEPGEGESQNAAPAPESESVKP